MNTIKFPTTLGGLYIARHFKLAYWEDLHPRKPQGSDRHPKCPPQVIIMPLYKAGAYPKHYYSPTHTITPIIP